MRYVKLYSNGIIEYFEPDKKTLKGTIEINEFCKVEVKNDYKFELYTDKRKFVFKHGTILLSPFNSKFIKFNI